MGGWLITHSDTDVFCLSNVKVTNVKVKIMSCLSTFPKRSKCWCLARRDMTFLDFQH